MFRFVHHAPPADCFLAITAAFLFLSPLDAQLQKAETQGVIGAKVSAADEASLRAALDAYGQGKPEMAEPIFRVLLKRYPNNYAMNEALGEILAEADSSRQALPFLEHASKMAPREALAHANLGATYLKLGQETEALRELERALVLDPKNGATFSNLGQARMATHQPALAGAAFARAADLIPSSLESRYNSALAYLESGSAEKAAVEIKKIPAEAMSDQAHNLAGDIDERLGNFKLSLIEYQAAARMNPSDENLYALTAELLRHWTWNEAIEVSNYGASRYPASKHFRIAEGVARYANNDYKGAVPLFAELLQAEPENATYADLLGRSCSLLTDGEGADCTGMHDFALRHPENAVTTTYAAAAILHEPKEKQDLGEVGRLLRAAIAADPKYAEAYFQMGVLDQSRLEWKESAKVLERSIALRSKSSQAHYRLSRAYAHLGRRDEAQAEMTLQQQLSQEEKDSLNTRLQEVVMFILKPS